MSNADEQAAVVDIVTAGLKRRYAAERRFRLFGLLSVVLGFVFLFALFASIISTGYPAFQSTYVQLDIDFDPAILDISASPGSEELSAANYAGLVKHSLRELFPAVKKRRERRSLYQLVSIGAEYELRNRLLTAPSFIGRKEALWLPANDDLDTFMKGGIDRQLPQENRRLSDQQLTWIDALLEAGRIEKRFNTVFFTSGDSREPELAGIKGALLGSFYTLIVTLVLSFPIGIAAAIYLEEFASRSRWTDVIEININNLAAVPSIVFGLLGLAVFINVFDLPRSAPLVGGLVLTLMTLPTIIIASRAALKSVPPSIREAALGVGASRMQMVTHHVLPLALPGMLTGTIIGMARALGESAPLLMIGMVAFIVDVPQSITEPATALPVQIYLWSDSPERAFTEKTSAAIIVLLVFLVVMNSLAVYLRKRFEKRW
ncbi:MAG: phosphate ABC transporter permease PstA [Gammaproteobacteria bacterium]|nr:phosphate ABC transporter permease PstA [Gammaproteobacteria bacterium]